MIKILKHHHLINDMVITITRVVDFFFLYIKRSSFKVKKIFPHIN